MQGKHEEVVKFQLPGAKHSGGYTRDLPDVFARAYGLTGDKSWLEWAKKAWDRGSKRGFKSTGQSAASDEVYTYAFCYPPRNDCSLTTGRTFYEVPRAK